MKVKVQKLGIIQSAEFNLKPLTIFVGPNNTGKTWLAYTLASILGTHGWYEYAQAYAGDQISKVYPPLDSAIDQLLTRSKKVALIPSRLITMSMSSKRENCVLINSFIQ